MTSPCARRQLRHWVPDGRMANLQQPATAFETHNGRSAGVAGTALHFPFCVIRDYTIEPPGRSRAAVPDLPSDAHYSKAVIHRVKRGIKR